MPEFESDPWIYRTVVAILGIAVLVVIIGAVLGRDIPQGVLAIASAAIGGLVGLLVPSPISKSKTGNPSNSGSQAAQDAADNTSTRSVAH